MALPSGDAGAQRSAGLARARQRCWQVGVGSFDFTNERLPARRSQELNGFQHRRNAPHTQPEKQSLSSLPRQGTGPLDNQRPLPVPSSMTSGQLCPASPSQLLGKQLGEKRRCPNSS